MVPMKTKNRPNAKERATSVIVLGEAISFLLPAPGASDSNDWESHGFPGKMHQGDGLLRARQTWRRAGPRSAAHLRQASWRDAALVIFHRINDISNYTLSIKGAFIAIFVDLRLLKSKLCVGIILLYYSIVRIIYILYIYILTYDVTPVILQS